MSKSAVADRFRAYINGVNFVARVNKVPAADNPWQIPNSAIVGDTAPYLTAGSKRLVFGCSIMIRLARRSIRSGRSR